MDHKIDPLVEVAKALPPAGIVGLQWLGVPLAEWVQLGAGLLILLQIFFLLRDKLWLTRKAKRDV
jgi:hypothetical protein